MRPWKILLLGLLWLGLAGCSPVVRPAQPLQMNAVILDAHNPVGQTFVARYNGLSGVQVQLSPGQSGDGELILQLKYDPLSEQVLSLPLTVSGPAPMGFDLQIAY